MHSFGLHPSASHRVLAGRKGSEQRPRLSVSLALPFFVGGNWKSNGTKSSINQLIGGLNQGHVDTSAVDVVIAPTFLHLDYVQQHIDLSKYKVAAQNVWLKGPGGEDDCNRTLARHACNTNAACLAAFTGEISAETLRDIGINWTITGHSERRALCGETSNVVAEKTRRALELGMSVIPCIGETLEERDGGRMFDVLTSQVQALVDHKVFGDDVEDIPSRVVLAYEPVWVSVWRCGMMSISLHLDLLWI